MAIYFCTWINDFFNINPNVDIKILQHEIKDFVSFGNLKTNKLSFFDNKKANYMFIHSGFCLTKIENAEMLDNSINTAELVNDSVSRAKLKDEVVLTITNSAGSVVKTLYGAGS